MATKSSKKIFQQIFIILAGSAFIIFSIAGILNMVVSDNSSSNNNLEQQTSQQEQLLQQAQGYELVLAKEPENPFALENLLAIHLQLGNLQKALPLAEKLVSLRPQDVRYQETLAAIKQGIVQQSQQQQNQSNTEVENQPNTEENNQQTQPEN